jgi:hypothetical protein
MLVVLSGTETVNKMFFARQLLAQLNTFVLGGYTIDFTDNNFKIYDPAGRLVVNESSDTDMEGNPLAGLAIPGDTIENVSPRIDIIDKAKKIRDILFQRGTGTNHYYDVFADVWYDHGFIKDVDAPFPERNLTYNIPTPHDYEHLLQQYEKRTYPVQVITGMFGRFFVERLRQDLGEQNVSVLNIIRNPSVVSLLHAKSAAHYENSVPPGEIQNREDDATKLNYSILNAMILKNTPGVQTVRYEDILRDKTFTFNGSNIKCPPTMNEGGNRYLTAWEKDVHIPISPTTSADVDTFNRRFQDYVPGEIKWNPEMTDLIYVTLEDLILKKQWRPGALQMKGNLTVEDLARVPKDIFAELGYTPLTYAEITA